MTFFVIIKVKLEQMSRELPFPAFPISLAILSPITTIIPRCTSAKKAHPIATGGRDESL